MMRNLFVALGLLLLLPGLAPAEPEGGQPRTERWYEIYRRGQKLGHSCVVWAPSTWEGRKTVHDTTTITERSVRNMMGIRDVFEVIMTIDLERGADGTLWWMRTSVEEAGRTTSEELRWNGKGYDHESRLGDVVRKQSIPLDQPVMTDSESFMGHRIRAGGVERGQKHTLRILDLRARRARNMEVEILGREEIQDDSVEGETKVATWKVRERDPVSGASSILWLDDDGAFVRLTTDGGDAYRRVPKATAEKRPARPAESRITVPSYPVLERVMSADRLDLELQVQGDENRERPTFPDSPWSRTLSVTGSDEAGWVYRMRLERYDDPNADTKLPIDQTKFERELEPTILMPCEHPMLKEAVRTIAGEETSARKAAYLLSRWVFDTLDKQSPEVGQASALEILESGEGDCSEHALLFVALCRAAGIPARRCSGYVSVGSQWGAHAWAEIWVGRWIGADPTTGEIGTAARYVFFGYPEQPDSHPGVVSSRASGRLRFVAKGIAEGDDDFALDDPERWHLHDSQRGRYVHVLAGLEARDVPKDWVVRMMGTRRAYVRAEGLRVRIDATADQGYNLKSYGGANGTFAGRPARVIRRPGRGELVIVHTRRRLVELQISGASFREKRDRLEAVLAPTFAARPTASKVSAPATPPSSD